MTLNEKPTILIVDDDLHILEVLDARLGSAHFRVLRASGAAEALDLLHDNVVDLMISDVRMPGMSGTDLFEEARALRPALPVIFLTAFGTIPDAVSALKAGATDYLTKPFDGRELLQKVRDVLKQKPAKPVQAPAAQQQASGPAASPHSPIEDVLSGGNSPVMRELFDLVERVAPSDVNVLILGESGVGKERVARLIHQRGARREHAFAVVDCGSTPAGLLESELFGHVRGAFTHAIRDKKGLIETADKGTLFLDEIGNISQDMQVRLLRFLEDRKIRRIGDIREIPVDCRVIAATNVDLPEEVEAGNFREDLYYRLRVVTLRIPPLRDRREDIPLLAQHFVENFCLTKGLPMVELPPETVRWLCDYPWPGNVRELKNAIEAGVVLCRNRSLRTEDLQLPDSPVKSAASHASQAPAAAPTPPPPAAGTTPVQADAFSLEESERNAIVRALQQANWVQKDAAQLLGISRRAIHYKIKKYAIEIAGKRGSAEDSPED